MFPGLFTARIQDVCVTITVSCTIQGVYISCGVAGSKPGARDRASENGMRIFDSRQVRAREMNYRCFFL